MNEQEYKFTRLVKENKSSIYTVCYMFSSDRDEVEDLFQQVLIRLWKGFETFRGGSAESSWVWKVALNTCISADRRNKNRKDNIPLDMNIDLHADVDDGSRQVQALHKRIGKLQLLDRALVLLWLEDLSYEEIGEIVGISSKNVGVRLVRIKEELRNMKDNN